LAPDGGSRVRLKIDCLNRNNLNNQNKIEILNLRSEICTKINDLMVNILNAGQSKDLPKCRFCRTRSNSGEQLYTFDNLKGLSPSALPPHIDQKFNTIVSVLNFAAVENKNYNMINLL